MTPGFIFDPADFIADPDDFLAAAAGTLDQPFLDFFVKNGHTGNEFSFYNQRHCNLSVRQGRSIERPYRGFKSFILDALHREYRLI